MESIAPPRPGTLARTPCVVPWWLIAVLALAFAALALVCHGHGTLAPDLRVSRWIQQWDQPLASQVSDLGNLLGTSSLALVVIVVCWVVFPLLGCRRELWFVTIVGVLRLAATQLKGVFDSPRPSTNQGIIVRASFDGLGFPSGHAMTSAVLFGTLVFLTWRLVPNRAARIAAPVALVAGVLATDVARIWTGAHWLSDVVGGTIAGLFMVALAANLSALISPDPATEPASPRDQTPA